MTGISFNRQPVVRRDGCGCGAARWRLSTRRSEAGGSKTRRVTRVDSAAGRRAHSGNASLFSPLSRKWPVTDPHPPPSPPLYHSPSHPPSVSGTGRTAKEPGVCTNNCSDRQGPRGEREREKGGGGDESSEERCRDPVFFSLSISHFRGRQVKGLTLRKTPYPTPDEDLVTHTQ